MNENGYENVNDYVTVFGKIGYYRANSDDASFHRYLDTVLKQAEDQSVPAAQLCYNLDANYERYRQVRAQMTGNGFAEGQPATEHKDRHGMEYKIGISVLSIVGATFILIALAYLSRYLLGNIAEAVIVYAVSLIAILISEIFLYKKHEILAKTVTSIGLVGLFTADYFSYFSLKLYSLEATMGILLGISLLAVVLTRARKTSVYEFLVFADLLASIALIRTDFTVPEFLLYAGLVIGASLMTLIRPYSEQYQFSTVVGIFALTMIGFAIYEKANFPALSGSLVLGFFLLAVFVQFLTLAMAQGDKAVTAFSSVGMGVLLCTQIMRSLKLDLFTLVLMGGMFLICLLLFLILMRQKEKYIPIAVFLLTETLIAWQLDNQVATLLIVSVCLILMKFFGQVRELSIVDAILSSMGMIIALCCYQEPLSYLLVAVLLIGSIMGGYCKLYHEFVLLLGGVLFAGLEAQGQFFLVPLIMLTVLILVLIDNLIPEMQVKGCLALNITGLVILAGCALYAPFVKTKDLTSLVCMAGVALIGTVAVLFLFGRKCRMETQARYVILAVFLTYLALTIQVDELWKSVTLMGVAFILIAVGCVANRMSIRIYGLALSLLVCLKVALWDFKNAAELNRMIVFLIVGVLAVLISLVYVLLEKHEQKELRQKSAATQEMQQPQPENMADRAETAGNEENPGNEETVNPGLTECDNIKDMSLTEKMEAFFEKQETVAGMPENSAFVSPDPEVKEVTGPSDENVSVKDTVTADDKNEGTDEE